MRILKSETTFSKNEKGKAMKEILVKVVGGRVEEVIGIPEGGWVCVRDYDTEGCEDDDRLKEDEDGEYFESWYGG